MEIDAELLDDTLMHYVQRFWLPTPPENIRERHATCLKKIVQCKCFVGTWALLAFHIILLSLVLHCCDF